MTMALPPEWGDRHDPRLAARAATGDQRAFAGLFERHHRPLLAFATRLTDSQADGEDVCQHTFTALWQHLQHRSVPQRLRGWLYAVARNRCLDVLRSPDRARTIQLADDDDHPQHHHAGPDHALEQRQELRGVLDDIAGLPEPQRAALLLYELADLPQAEIAE